MPTPESAAAFQKLAEARAILNAISVKLRKAIDPGGDSPDEQRYRHLQKLWDEALRAFEAATDELVAMAREIEPPQPEAQENAGPDSQR